MSSTFVLISLLLSLSMAVLVPELKDSKKPIFSLSPEYDYMVNKQRKGFLSIGLLAVSTFLFQYKPYQSHYLFCIYFSIFFLVYTLTLLFKLGELLYFRIH